MDHQGKAGSFVTENLNYDGGRQVTVYVPPETPRVIVFAGDGQRISKWGGILQGANATPTMIVGVHSLDDEMSRLKEYSPEFNGERFAAHEKFFVHDVREWAGKRFNIKMLPSCTAVLGTSAGGELALAIGLRHPNIYGAIFCASPGGGFRPSPDKFQNRIPKTYLVAGMQEPFFRDNALRWAEALRQANADVVMEERDGDHGGSFWQDELPLMISWAFRTI